MRGAPHKGLTFRRFGHLINTDGVLGTQGRHSDVEGLAHDLVNALPAPDIGVPIPLFLEKFSLICVWKFPVPLRREFGWKLLNP
jgi:hypothetical protein